MSQNARTEDENAVVALCSLYGCFVAVRVTTGHYEASGDVVVSSCESLS